MQTCSVQSNSARSRRKGPLQTRAGALASALVAAVLALALPADGIAAAGGPTAMPDDADSWIDILNEDTGAVGQKYVEIQLILSSQQWARVSAEQRAHINQLLAGVLNDLDLILAPGLNGVLPPPVTGVVDPSYDPQTLDEYAQACLELTDAALAELAMAPGAFDQHAYVSALLTMEHLITRRQPHGFLTAGAP